MGWYNKNAGSLYGFRTGCLAGLEGEEREERIRQERRLYGYHSPRFLETPRLDYVGVDRRTRANTTAPAGSSLEEALTGATLTSLREAARKLGIKKMSAAPREELMERLMRAVPLETKRFEELLTITDNEAFETLKRALLGKQVSHPVVRPRHNIPDLLPFAFASQQDASCVTFMPPELQAAFGGVDINRIERNRSLKLEVISTIHTYVTLCGVAPLDEVYAYFHSQTELEDVTMEAFFHVIQTVTEWQGNLFRLVEFEGVTYLVHRAIDIKRGFLAHDSQMDQEVDRWLYAHSVESWFYATDDTQPPAGHSWEVLFKQQRGVAARLSGDMPIKDVSRFIYGLPCVRALTGYFDNHIPYGEDDYTFSDNMVDLLIYLFLVKGSSLSDVLRWLSRTGWNLGEGTNSSPELTRLVYRLSRQLPRWEYHGWSEEEYLDLMNLPALISDTQDFEDAEGDDVDYEGLTDTRLAS